MPRPQRALPLGWLHDAAAALATVSQAGYVGLPLLVLAVALPSEPGRAGRRGRRVIANIPYISPAQPSSRAALPGFRTAGQYRHYLARGETVLVISGRGNAGLLLQAVTGGYFRIAGGYVNQAMAERTDLPAEISDLNAAGTSAAGRAGKTEAGVALDYLEDSGVGAVLFEDNSPRPHLLSTLRGMRLRSRVVGGITMFRIPHDLS